MTQPTNQPAVPAAQAAGPAPAGAPAPTPQPAGQAAQAPVPPPPRQRPPIPTPPEHPALPNDSAKMDIEATIRYRMCDPYHFFNTGGPEVVKKTIVSLAESMIRSAASRMKVDAFIAQKLDAANAIQGGLNKCSPGTLDFKPTVSSAVTIAFGMILCSAIAILAPQFVHDPQTVKYVRALALLYFFAGFRNIPTEHGGVVTFVEKRLWFGRHKEGRKKGVHVGEGRHWFPWLLMGVLYGDMREQIVDMKVPGVIVGNAQDADAHVPCFEQEIDQNFALESGTDARQVILSKIMPDAKVLEAMEKARIETANMIAARRVVQEAIVDIADLKNALGTNDEQFAAAVFASVVGKPIPQYSRTSTIDHDIIDVRGASDADKALGSGIAFIREAGNMFAARGGGGKGGGGGQGQGGGGGRKGRGRGRGGQGNNPGNQGGQPNNP